MANVQSAGLESHGLNPLAVKVMKEIGIDISNQNLKITLDLKMYDVLFTGMMLMSRVQLFQQ